MSEIEILHQARYLRLCRRGTWEYAERTNSFVAVIVVAITPDDKVLFVEQFRYPLMANTIEMPAGLVGDVRGHEDEDMMEAARRELEEETGWTAESFDFIMAGPTSAGMSNEMIAFVRARGLKRTGSGGGDPSEEITVHEVPRIEVARWLFERMQQGDSIDPKLYAGLYFLDHDADGSNVE
ncbi:MAG TPA: NUDIX hydrolase [Xanthomonadaceae bacterium]|nr:NUDIX hydrolase [Xanthomonadaceae bacterium]